MPYLYSIFITSFLSFYLVWYFWLKRIKILITYIQFLCEFMNTDCEIDCNARCHWLRSCLGHQITQGRHWFGGMHFEYMLLDLWQLCEIDEKQYKMELLRKHGCHGVSADLPLKLSIKEILAHSLRGHFPRNLKTKHLLWVYCIKRWLIVISVRQ